MKQFALGLAAIVLSSVVAAPSYAALITGNVPLYFPTLSGSVSSSSTTPLPGGDASTAPTLTFSGNGTATTFPTAAAAFLPPGATITSAFFQFSYSGFNAGNIVFDILSNGNSTGPITIVAGASDESSVFNILPFVIADGGINPLAFVFETTGGAVTNITSAFQLEVVPEPTTMAGLFVFGAVVATRKKLAKKAAV